jgi:NAD(P)H-flavin reductase
MNNNTQDPMVPQLYQVAKIIRETHDSFSLQLESKSDSIISDFGPGQFNMLYAFGVGEVPISISGQTEKSGNLIHTIRNVGTVTAALADLKKGHTLGLRGPFGSSWPIEACKKKDVVVIAGGIGLAPLRPAIYALLKEREKFGEIAVLYGARQPKDLLFTNEFENWRGKYGVQVKVTVDSADREWKGNVGVVTTLIPRVSFDPVHTVAMICGPEIMMKFSVLALKQAGMSEKNIYITMERNMKCAVGFCGHCQFGPAFVCKDGPVFAYNEIKPFFETREF